MREIYGIKPGGVVEAPEHHGELIEGKDHYTSDTK